MPFVVFVLVLFAVLFVVDLLCIYINNKREYVAHQCNVRACFD